MYLQYINLQPATVHKLLIKYIHDFIHLYFFNFQHNNPYVMVMVNDGTQSYSHETYVYSSFISILVAQRNRLTTVKVIID